MHGTSGHPVYYLHHAEHWHPAEESQGAANVGDQVHSGHGGSANHPLSHAIGDDELKLGQCATLTKVINAGLLK